MTPVRRAARLGVACLFTLVLGLAAASGIRRYLAEKRLETVVKTDIERSIRLAPDNSEAWARLGAILEREGQANEAVRALEQAVRLNPYNGGALVDLALHWEISGEAQRAERCLLEAVRVQGGAATYWALANFYLRQGVDDRFWNALRTLLGRSRVDLEAAFDLGWRASDDPAEIARKAVPDDPDILRAYFKYLINRKKDQALAAAWERLAPHLNPQDADAALIYAGSLLDARRVSAAAEVWNQLCRRRLLPYTPLDPAHGRLITNGQFEARPIGQGFDWRIPPADGVETVVENPGREGRLRILLSGSHPESADILWQWAPALPNRTYRLTFRHRSESLPDDTGLRWTIWDDTVPIRPALLAEGRLTAQEAWTATQASVRTRPATRLLRIVFSYQRPVGATRALGEMMLAGVALGGPLESTP